ncbi:glutamate--ammonia ligase [Microbotryomycetes sp. JL201]|nr:glutamate--ammonia ligase [Microbotryomycetes sp. JL201]
MLSWYKTGRPCSVWHVLRRERLQNSADGLVRVQHRGSRLISSTPAISARCRAKAPLIGLHSSLQTYQPLIRSNGAAQWGRRPGLALSTPLPSFARLFHASTKRQDVFFVSIPAVKQVLLTVVRSALVLLPLAIRWGWFKRFPRHASRLWQLPLLGMCLVIALGLNQSPKTARWRLLLMSPREELEWSNKRFEEIIAQEENLVLPPSDERTFIVKRVCDRLIQALNDDQALSCVSVVSDGHRENVRVDGVVRKRRSIAPSARTEMTMPFLPETSNPEKIIPRSSWSIFCVDLPRINAFVLPSTDIFIYTGLLSVTEDDENLLAAVLAHEISHCVERHVVESLGFMALSGVFWDILRGTTFVLTLSFPFLGDALASGFNFLDRQVSQRAYSRKLETEADVLGLELMARAGFDPRGAIALWEILNEVESDVSATGEHGTITDHIAFLRTHPTGERRIEELKRAMPKAVKLYEEALKERTRIQDTKEAMKRVAAQEEENAKRNAAQAREQQASAHVEAVTAGVVAEKI